MFVEKYKPHCLAEYVGQKEAVQMLTEFMKTKSKKALLLHGPAGTGKTCLVEAYAKENGMELVEMNASDIRSEDEIKKILGAASKQSSLFNRKKIILVDEVDGISGREDEGGVAAIIELIKESSFPVILTANNPWNPRLKTLRTHATVVEFKRLPVRDVQKKLGQIAVAEKINNDIAIMNSIAKKSNGDMRSAMND
ncbi:AAA family ATPase, partial [archaeon]